MVTLSAKPAFANTYEKSMELGITKNPEPNDVTLNKTEKILNKFGQ